MLIQPIVFIRGWKLILQLITRVILQFTSGSSSLDCQVDTNAHVLLFPKESFNTTIFFMITLMFAR